jgi:mono/diheme cytochrome c family protein
VTRSVVIAAGLAAALVSIVVRADQGGSSTSAPVAPTFAADVATIVYKNCAVCHRPGQSAPFALLSYDDVKRHGDEIAEVVGTRYMPPWHAMKAEGFAEFADERRLTDPEIATLTKWIAAGMPAGDLAKAPKAPTFTSGWALGTPDLVLKLPSAVAVPADGPDTYRNVLLPVNLPDDRWIRAIEFRPSARRVVHHMLLFATPAGVTVGADEAIPGLGGGGAGRGRAAGRGAARGQLGRGRGLAALAGEAGAAFGGLGGWVPGVTPRFYPDGIAQPFTKNSNLVAQFHFHPSGKAEVEQGELAVYFSKTPPAKSLTGIQVPPAFGIGMGIDIPPGEAAYTIKDSFVLPVDVEAVGARAHAHYLAKQMTMIARLPDGRTQGLLKIDDWDFGWQDSYFFKSAVRLPKGTTIDATIVYDNSSSNLRNPHSPPQRVIWGRESFDEMGSLSLLVGTATGSADQQVLRAAQAQQLREQLLRRLR